MPYVKDSEIHGHGVFADKDYSPYEGDTDFMVVLGLGMVYNHSDAPNAEWEVCESDDRFVKFFALTDIKQDEEILHDYGEGYWKSR
jgi:SET domain-containing protein